MARSGTATRSSRNGNGSARIEKPELEDGQHELELKPMKLQRITFVLHGTTSLVMDNGERGIASIERGKNTYDSAAGDEKPEKKTTRRGEPVDRGTAWQAAAYRLEDGRLAIPKLAIARAIASGSAVMFKTQLRREERTDFVSQAFRLIGDDFIALDAPHNAARLFRTLGRNANPKGKGSTSQGTVDVRYRAEVPLPWRLQITAELRLDMITVPEFIQAAQSAGLSVGIGGWRPEKHGDHGRFTVDPATGWATK